MGIDPDERADVVNRAITANAERESQPPNLTLNNSNSSGGREVATEKPERGRFVASNTRRSIPRSLFHYFQSKGKRPGARARIQSREIVPVMRALTIVL